MGTGDRICESSRAIAMILHLPDTFDAYVAPIVCRHGLRGAFFNPMCRKIAAYLLRKPNHFLGILGRARGDQTTQGCAWNRFYVERQPTHEVSARETFLAAARFGPGDLDRERLILHLRRRFGAELERVDARRKGSHHEGAVGIGFDLLHDFTLRPLPQGDFDGRIVRHISTGIRRPRCELRFAGFKPGTFFFAPELLCFGMGDRATPVPRSRVRVESLKCLFECGCGFRAADRYAFRIGECYHRQSKEDSRQGCEGCYWRFHASILTSERSDASQILNATSLFPAKAFDSPLPAYMLV